MRRRGVLGVLFRLRLLGSGFDDFLLPGDSVEEVTVYLVKCPKGHYEYYSPNWVRGAKCPECGRKMNVSETKPPEGK
jgi:hypothetical protein